MPSEPVEIPAPVVVCDAIESIGTHNGVVRISLLRLRPDGEMMPALELLMPHSAVGDFLKVLQSVKP